MQTLYNRQGRAVAYVDDDGESVYLYTGEPVAFGHDEWLYTYSGRCLGWMELGWVYDLNGNPAFFTDAAQGGPLKPVRQVRPVRGVRGVRPVRGVRQVRPVRPVKRSTWSAHSDESFFEG